jgi:hypothetical protein
MCKPKQNWKIWLAKLPAQFNSILFCIKSNIMIVTDKGNNKQISKQWHSMTTQGILWKLGKNSL